MILSKEVEKDENEEARGEEIEATNEWMLHQNKGH